MSPMHGELRLLKVLRMACPPDSADHRQAHDSAIDLHYRRDPQFARFKRKSFDASILPMGHNGKLFKGYIIRRKSMSIPKHPLAPVRQTRAPEGTHPAGGCDLYHIAE